MKTATHMVVAAVMVLGLLCMLVAETAAAESWTTAMEGGVHPLALSVVGVDRVRGIDPNMTGKGVSVAVVCRSMSYADGEPQNDYRPAMDHRCFANSRLAFYDEGKVPAGISAHSTAICSILFGRDVQGWHPKVGTFRYEGVVPDAEGKVYEFWHFLIHNVFPQSPPEAEVVSVSIGNTFEDWWTRGFDALAEHHGLIVVAGIGNGQQAYDPPLYPGASANVIGVGVVDSVNVENLRTQLAWFSLAYPEHSSGGPTSKGRCKPDLVAPGNCLVAVPDEPNQYEPGGNWSSFSTPVVAGAVGLLVQKAKQEGLWDAISPVGSNTVIKAILLTSARKLPYWHKGRLETDDDHIVPLDCVQGAGMLDVWGAYQQLLAGQGRPGLVAEMGWDNNRLEKRGELRKRYRFVVEDPNEQVITATLVWNRHYASRYPFEPIPQRDTNLRLELWALDPDTAERDVLLDYSDSMVDNVEHIYCPATPGYKVYELVVCFSGNDEAGTGGEWENYGLAWSVRTAGEQDSLFWYDLNADGVVDEMDLTILIEGCLRSRQYKDGYFLGDLNGDGRINADDIKILIEQADRRAPWHVQAAGETER